jgi:hypothetical protein
MALPDVVNQGRVELIHLAGAVTVLAVTRKKEGVDLAGQQPDGVAPLVLSTFI